MDAYSHKKTAREFGVSTRGASLAFRDPNHENRKYCNRLGCSTRFNSLNDFQITKPEKPKYPRGSFRSTCSKASSGNSSRSFSPSADIRKPCHEREGQTSLQVLSSGESSSRREDIVDLESDGGNRVTEHSGSIPTGTEIHTILPDSEETTDKSSTGSTASSLRSRKPISKRAAFADRDTSSSSSFRRCTTSRSITHTSKPTSHGFKNLSCTTESDILPSGCSSSDFGRNKRVETVRKGLSNGESSSSRRKSTSGLSSGGLSGSHSCHCAPSVSHSEGPLPYQVSRRVRNRPARRDDVVSVRTRQPSTRETRMRLSEQEDGSTLSPPEPNVIPQPSEAQVSIAETAPESSSRFFPAEVPLVFHNSFVRPGSSSRSGRNRSAFRPEGSRTQVFHAPLGDRDDYRHFSMEGVAEVLLALERIEQDEELTLEQLMVLETNFFLGGLSSHDQHRDMRLDIDNMSYEELLALGEKMGTVSTALSEEALEKCLRRSICTSALVPGINGQGDDDTKCSICQEEYVVGDEVGKLACEHRYHTACIHQWLRLKNWCPICKASACLSS